MKLFLNVEFISKGVWVRAPKAHEMEVSMNRQRELGDVNLAQQGWGLATINFSLL